MSLEAFFGGTPASGLVLAAGYTVVTRGRGTLFGLDALVQYYPDPRGGLHFEALAGLSGLSGFGAYTRGVGVAAGLGYDFWVGSQTSLGAAVRGGYAKGLDGDRANTAFFALAGVFTWH
jgi:hypothetical protein